MPVAGGDAVTMAVGMLLPLGVLAAELIVEDVGVEEIVADCATDEVVMDWTPAGLRVWIDDGVFETWETTGGVVDAVDVWPCACVDPRAVGLESSADKVDDS